RSSSNWILPQSARSRARLRREGTCPFRSVLTMHQKWRSFATWLSIDENAVFFGWVPVVVVGGPSAAGGRPTGKSRGGRVRAPVPEGIFPGPPAQPRRVGSPG